MGWLSTGFQTAISHWVRRIRSKLVLSSWPKSWVSLLKWDFLRKSQSAFLRNERTQLSFQSHQNLLVLMSLEPFWKWLLACPCSQSVKGFPLFSWCCVELHPYLRKQHAEDNCVLRSDVNPQNGFPVGFVLHYLHMSIGLVIAQLSLQRGRSSLPRGDFPHSVTISLPCLLLWASSVFYHSFPPQSDWGLWNVVWGVLN